MAEWVKVLHQVRCPYWVLRQVPSGNTQTLVSDFLKGSFENGVFMVCSWCSNPA